MDRLETNLLPAAAETESRCLGNKAVGHDMEFQGSPESRLTPFGGGFEVIRTDAANVAVTPPWIVE